MKRSETGLLLLAILVTASIVLLDLFAGNYLNTRVWFGSAANIVQLYSAPGLLAAIALAGWARWHRTCAVPYCLRSGEHPVKGTLQKVCVHHHHREHHELVHRLYAEEHRLSGRLDRGESHDLPT